MRNFINSKTNKLKMMLVMTLFCTSTGSISAQEWNWAKGFGQSSGSCMLNDMKKISNNEIAAVGYFETPFLKIGNDSLNGTGNTPLVCTIDKDGNFKKAIAFGEIGAVNPLAIATDLNDNIYVAGNFNSLIFTAGSDTLLNKGMSDGFLVKLDKDLNIIWTIAIATQFEDIVDDLNVDSKGNIYLGGGTVTSNSYPKYTYEAYLIKISPESNILWENRGKSDILTYTESVFIDNEDNCYWIGIGDSINFANGISFNSSTNINNTFIIKVSSDGQWMKSHFVSPIEGAYLDQQNLYIVQKVAHDTTYGIKTIKFNSNFEIIWQRDLTNLQLLSFDSRETIRIAVDNEKNLYLTGALVSEKFEFAQETYTGFNPTTFSENHTNIYIFKYNTDGEEIWAKKLGNLRQFFNLPAEILAYGDDELVLSANYQSDTLDFGGVFLYNNSKIDSFYFHGTLLEYKKFYSFIASFGRVKTSISTEKTFQTTLYPNPVHDALTLVLSETNFKKGKVDIYNINGTLLKSQAIHSGENNLKIDSKDLPIGTHIVHIQIDEKYSVQKIVKQ